MNREPAKERLHVHGHVARPRLDAGRERARRQHFSRNGQCERLAKFAWAYEKTLRRELHADEQVCYSTRFVDKGALRFAQSNKVGDAQSNARPLGRRQRRADGC